MFAPDHERAARELVRVCRADGRVAMTTWVNDGFNGELFTMTASFLPPPPAGVQPPSLWGVESHVKEAFAAAGTFGVFVMARTVLEPEGRWPEFVQAFADLVRRFNVADDGSATIRAGYLLITVDR